MVMYESFQETRSIYHFGSYNLGSLPSVKNGVKFPEYVKFEAKITYYFSVLNK